MNIINADEILIVFILSIAIGFVLQYAFSRNVSRKAIRLLPLFLLLFQLLFVFAFREIPSLINDTACLYFILNIPGGILGCLLGWIAYIAARGINKLFLPKSDSQG